MKKFDDSERIHISAIKQYAYCKRRFGLMFIDCEWGSNYKIIEGDIMHEKVDDPFIKEKRKDVIISRSVPVFSKSLDLYGIADAVEFIKNSEGTRIQGKKDLWGINPIEYKNGKPEKSNADNLQLCAQAIALEEMFGCQIYSGEIFYGSIKRRIKIELTDDLKGRVRDIVEEIRYLFSRQIVPQKPENQNCALCSLIDICMPEIFTKRKTNKQQIYNLIKEEINAKIIK